MGQETIGVELTTDEARALLVLATHAHRELSAVVPRMPEDRQAEIESITDQLRLVEGALGKMFEALRAAEL